MEKERKTIKCSYAVLVIILCAAVAILTDYIVIDRKMNKCNCPKCEVMDKYTYESIAAHYSGYPLDSDDSKRVSDLRLYSDGTYSYGQAPGIKSIGNYIIVDDEIRMNDILSVGSDPTMNVLYSSKVLKINNDGSFTFYDANIKPGLGDYPEYVKDVKFIKEKDILNEENSFDDAMDNLNRYYINRNGN